MGLGRSVVRRLASCTFLAICVAGLACGGAGPEPVKLDAQGVPILPEEDGTKRITPEQVAWMREQKIPFLFVDSRSREDHRAGRPAGSVNVPLQMTEIAASRLPGDRLIVTFCT
jgi:hypothetical protein